MRLIKSVVITAAIPAQPGRSQTIVIEDATTNSLTIRDTEENIRLFAKLISSLDKDRAEVVMDVAIYEVNKNDLLEVSASVSRRDQDRSRPDFLEEQIFLKEDVVECFGRSDVLQLNADLSGFQT